jgi:hypothetical protein
LSVQQVSCLLSPSPTNSTLDPTLYLTLGALPNSNWTSINAHSDQWPSPGYDWYAQIGFRNPGGIVSVFSRPPLTFGDPIGYFFGIGAGSTYHELDKIQCTIRFRPANFEVAVALANRTISATISESRNAVADPDPAGYLRAYAMDSLWLSMIVSSLYVSTVGDALRENIQNHKIRQNIPLGANATSNLVLAAVEDAVTAMLDAVFVALKSATLTVQGATYTAPVEVTSAAVRIGSGAFILAVVVINLVALVAIIAIHVLLWKENVPMFDYNDLGSMVIAVATTKDDSMEAMTANGNDCLSAWSGDPQSPDFGHVTATLEVSSPAGQPAIALKYT